MKSFSPKVKIIEGRAYVFDSIRKKYLLLTPEEKVRQLFLHILIHEKGFSKNLIAIEQSTKYHQLKKRTDILVYNNSGQPFLLVECKAEFVPISRAVLEQASRYNQTIQAPFLCVTNARKTYCFEMDFENNTTTQLADLPSSQV